MVISPELAWGKNNAGRNDARGISINIYAIIWSTDRCKDNYPDLNPTKAKEIVFDFRVKKATNPEDYPICVNGENIKMVDSYKYLGTCTIDRKIDWTEHIKSLYKKGNQRLHLLRVLKSFRVDMTIMSLFYTSVIESIITHYCIVWYNAQWARMQPKCAKSHFHNF